MYTNISVNIDREVLIQRPHCRHSVHRPNFQLIIVCCPSLQCPPPQGRSQDFCQRAIWSEATVSAICFASDMRRREASPIE